MGLLPVVLGSKGFSPVDIDFLAGIYAAVWGMEQLLCLGMMLLGVAIAALYFAESFAIMLFAIAAVGAETAMVYPTLLSLVAENPHPGKRSQSLGIFRFWRGFGYVRGALAAGFFIDLFGAEVVLLLPV